MSFDSMINEVYNTRRVRDAKGTEYALAAEVDRAEGDYLLKLILADPTIVRTLEVGCAYGLSSLFICEGLKGRTGASHTIVDPGQNEVWHGVGISQLQRFGYDFFTLLESPSELALPHLLNDQSETFDFAFIDGWHTFDHTMLDLYYACRLVRVGGYILIDDSNWPSVSAAVAYYSNYPMLASKGFPQLHEKNKSPLRTIGRSMSKRISPHVAQWIMPSMLHDRLYRRSRFPSVMAFKKVAHDDRSWDWYQNF